MSFVLSPEEAAAIEAVRMWADGGCATTIGEDHLALSALIRRDCGLPAELEEHVRYVCDWLVLSEDIYATSAVAFIEAWDAGAKEDSV